ncbi:hypothetical protein [Terrabacter sp. NPDC000476]|uniref:hypothetical protein n=1 Tax=Terrabacter sp. NPDC000476 TaxID=3154258 RepID=UPI003321C8FD
MSDDGSARDRHCISEKLREVGESLAPERKRTAQGWSPMTHTLVTVVCREGRVVPTRVEFRWLDAWRFSNHLTCAYNGDVYIVTPHGWTGVLDSRAGWEPRSRPHLELPGVTDP